MYAKYRNIFINRQSLLMFVVFIIGGTINTANALEDEKVYVDKHFYWSNYDKPLWDPHDSWDDRDIFRFVNIYESMYAVRSSRGKTR
ncbi:MAG: hypothetical protein JXQ80_00780, partial [Bacteroidales bacterium]|nr:hypothetical protein [Bacteroidales bacterium]